MKRSLMIIAVIPLFFLSCQQNGNRPTEITDTTHVRLGSLNQQQDMGDSYKQAIKSVLDQDVQVSTEANGNDSLVAAGMKQINLAQCPRDFAVVYVAHTQAWEYSAALHEAIAAYKSGEVTRTAGAISVIQAIFGARYTALDDVQSKIDSLENKVEHNRDEIRLTYNKVQQTAVSYGVQLH